MLKNRIQELYRSTFYWQTKEGFRERNSVDKLISLPAVKMSHHVICTFSNTSFLKLFLTIPKLPLTKNNSRTELKTNVFINSIDTSVKLMASFLKDFINSTKVSNTIECNRKLWWQYESITMLIHVRLMWIIQKMVSYENQNNNF